MAPDSSKIAFYRKDESKVSTFPLLDITTRTGSLKEIKYPMAGMDSENVQLGVYDIATGKTAYMKVDEYGYDQYLTNISWTPDASKVLVQVLDRSQKHMKLNMYDAGNGSLIKTILTEDNEKYVEPLDPVWFVKGSDDIFIYRTDNRDGYRNGCSRCICRPPARNSQCDNRRGCSNRFYLHRILNTRCGSRHGYSVSNRRKPGIPPVRSRSHTPENRRYPHLPARLNNTGCK